MTYFPLNAAQIEWKDRVTEITVREIGPLAEETDRAGQYPQRSLDALKQAGLWGLRASREDGGLAPTWSRPVWWSRRSPRSAPRRRCATRCTSKRPR